jgi:sarcosine oxidase, subunit gamma
MAKAAAKMLARGEPGPTVSAKHAGVVVALAPPTHRWSLRARDPKQLEKILGVKLPRKIGETIGEIACLGPDEWLWRSAKGAPKDLGAGQPVGIVDISERSVCLIVEGPNARVVVNAGCPLDLENFAIGRTTRTIFEGVEIILCRESPDRWTVEVWRSFAEWLWLSLNEAAAYP